MARWRSKEERVRLRERAVYLRDEQKLKWVVIAERLGLHSGTTAIYHYKKGKLAEKIGLGNLKFKEIEPFAKKYGIEVGYVWLYENGFRTRVPTDVQLKIEDGKFGIGSVPKSTRLRFEKHDGRNRSISPEPYNLKY